MKARESDWIFIAVKQLVSAINSALAMSPGSQEHLKRLEGCRLCLHFTSMEKQVYVGIINTQHTSSNAALGSNTHSAQYHVSLLDDLNDADVTIKGSPIAFIKLLSQKNKAILFTSKEISLEGDSVRIQQILAFLNSLKIDWEGLLSNFLGDVPAHFLGSTIRSGLSWGLNFSQSLIRDTEEFIKYELRLLPDNRRAQKQFTAINALAESIDDLNTRFEQLEAKLATNSPK